MKYKLMIKTHMVTGLKYLCVTTRSDYHRYTGSGKQWKKHLEEHGRTWSTDLLYESDNIEDFSKTCIEKSIEFDIVSSKDWANCRLERGGGEYPVDSSGNKILRSKPMSFASDEELLEYSRKSKWFQCSICGAKMTEDAFLGRNHNKCKSKDTFNMIPFKNEWL